MLLFNVPTMKATFTDQINRPVEDADAITVGFLHSNNTPVYFRRVSLNLRLFELMERIAYWELCTTEIDSFDVYRTDCNEILDLHQSYKLLVDLGFYQDIELRI